MRLYEIEIETSLSKLACIFRSRSWPIDVFSTSKTLTLPLNAFFGCAQRPPVIVVPAFDVLNISGSTVNMNVVTSNRINKVGGSPKANAPAVSRVGGVADPVLPVPPLLAGDLPKALTVRVP